MSRHILKPQPEFVHKNCTLTCTFHTDNAQFVSGTEMCTYKMYMYKLPNSKSSCFQHKHVVSFNLKPWEGH